MSSALQTKLYRKYEIIHLFFSGKLEGGAMQIRGHLKISLRSRRSMAVAHIWGSEGTLSMCVFQQVSQDGLIRHMTTNILGNKHIRVWRRFGAVLGVQLRIPAPITVPGGRCAQIVGAVTGIDFSIAKSGPSAGLLLSRAYILKKRCGGVGGGLDDSLVYHTGFCCFAGPRK